MIEYPSEPTYWIITAGGRPVAGVTKPGEVTSAGPQWTLLFKTTDEAEWQAECARLIPPQDEV